MHIEIHKAEDRGKMEIDWLSTRYSFSFANWFNPNRMGFGALRVLNDDTIAPHSGFPPHSHKDMEIITVVTSGKISHTDSMGNTDIEISEGEIQIMSAGSGVTHSEMNLQDDPLTLFQIWITPNTYNIAPRYEQEPISWQPNSLTQLVGPTESAFPLTMYQDAYMYGYTGTEALTHKLSTPNHGLYVFVIDGELQIEDQILSSRDAAAISQTQQITIAPATETKLLLFEVPLEN